MEKIITIDRSNIDQEHICCAIGNDKTTPYSLDRKVYGIRYKFFFLKLINKY